MLQHTVEAWRTVFFISACIHIFGAIFYGVFGTADQQTWGNPSDHVATLRLST